MDAVRKAKRALIIKGASAGTKNFWRYIKLCTGFGKTTKFKMPWHCANSVSAKFFANAINKYFMQQVDDIICKFIPLTKIDLQHSLNRNNDNLFCFHSITTQEIKSALHQLRDSLSMGIDFISTATLKLSAEEIAPILTHIFNHSISCCFPTQWKQAIVLPIFTKGDSSVTNNYWPISLLLVVSKALERVFALQLTKFL